MVNKLARSWDLKDGATAIAGTCINFKPPEPNRFHLLSLALLSLSFISTVHPGNFDLHEVKKLPWRDLMKPGGCHPPVVSPFFPAPLVTPTTGCNLSLLLAVSIGSDYVAL